MDNNMLASIAGGTLTVIFTLIGTIWRIFERRLTALEKTSSAIQNKIIDMIENGADEKNDMVKEIECLRGDMKVLASEIKAVLNYIQTSQPRKRKAVNESA